MTIIIFFSLNFLISNYNQITKKSVFKAGFEVEKEIVNQNEVQIESQINVEEKREEQNTEEWYLEIPCIELKANIQEGTTKETMDKYIGHFEETQKSVGNVGLAAHNRGYENNYFARLKELKEGDEIYYYSNGIKKKYVVETVVIIKDTDWTYLENTEDNIITLITCVENEPEYRRCIQGREKIESEEN